MILINVKYIIPLWLQKLLLKKKDNYNNISKEIKIIKTTQLDKNYDFNEISNNITNQLKKYNKVDMNRISYGKPL